MYGDRPIGSQAGIDSGRQLGMDMSRLTGRQTGGQIHEQIDMRVGRWTDKQFSRHAGGQLSYQHNGRGLHTVAVPCQFTLSHL